jgi:formylglycine-generating enzyme required for sulfatase activity
MILWAPECSSKPEPSQGNTGHTAKDGVSIAPSSSQAEPPKELTLDLGGGVTMKLVLIPAGKFLMGSPDSEKERDYDKRPQHEVTISKPFYMGVTEVTQAQYQAIMHRNPSKFRDAANPVEWISWYDAADFCKKLSGKIRQAVRLPTEAEWEYACRAGSKTKFCFGDADEDLGDYAWYYDNSGRTTQAVGQKKPNAWGLYDMHGNVSEWCSDWHDRERVADLPRERVLRGGNWNCPPGYCCSARRLSYPPTFICAYNGLRVVVEVGPGL